MDLNKMTATEIGKEIKNRKISSVEVTQNIIDNIKKTDNKINAYILLVEEQALSDARDIQKRIDAKEDLSPIAGVPMALKDNICTKDIATTCASKTLSNFIPPYSATVYKKLKNTGSVLLGKLNMDEFGMGGSGETSYYGAIKNPWDSKRVPGGSSGGSAAAVAAGQAFYTLGSDTGGSIRQPCSYCNISGIKPTYGAVSRYGLVALASSLDQIGPMGKDIKDCAEILNIISGHDEKDATSANRKPLDFSKSFDGEIKGLKIGIPKNCFNDNLDKEIKKSVLESAVVLEKLGAVIEEFELPFSEYALPAYHIISSAEASTNLSRFDGIKYGHKSKDAENLLDVYLNSRSEGFGMEAKLRIMLGSLVLSSAYYDVYFKKALQVRGLVQKSYSQAFDKYDVLLTPTTSTTAFKIGEKISDPHDMYSGDIYTASVNLAGIPAAAIPCGFSSNRLPIGMQLIGKAFSEPLLVKVSYAFQLNTDFHKKQPSLLEGGKI